ncbi:DMT family transporter [Nitrospira sp. Kam-Ns4a]
MVPDGPNGLRATLPSLALLAAVLVLSTMSPVTKELLRQGTVAPFDFLWFRVLLACLFLTAIALVTSRRELAALAWPDALRLSLLGMLAVGLGYGCAAWGLMYTTVTHYVLIYSLQPSFTALFSCLMRQERMDGLTLTGIALSLLGCFISVSEGRLRPVHETGFGDALVLLFTVTGSAGIVLSTGAVRRYGPTTVTTVMFGSSALALALATGLWSVPSHALPTATEGIMLAYVGIATAAVFLLRSVSLKSLTPTTVGAFHNLVPVLGTLWAHLFLGEPLGPPTIIGGLTILAGVELVRRARDSRPDFPVLTPLPKRA